MRDPSRQLNFPGDGIDPARVQPDMVDAFSSAGPHTVSLMTLGLTLTVPEPQASTLVLALRPKLLRVYAGEASLIDERVQLASRIGARLIWRLATEVNSLVDLTRQLDLITREAANLTHAIEIGDRPWAHAQSAHEYAQQASVLIAQIAEQLPETPIVLGLSTPPIGVEPNGWPWFLEVWPLLRDLPARQRLIAVTVAPSRPGRHLAVRRLKFTRDWVHAWTGLTIALVDLGWPSIGRVRGLWNRVRYGRRLTPRLQQRWVREAATVCTQLEAAYGIMSANRDWMGARGGWVWRQPHQEGRASRRELQSD